MISELRLDKFQGFGSETTISFRPLTLIFGPNASGKSSIGRALRLIANSLHSDETRMGVGFEVSFESSKVSFASFENVVYRHDPDSSLNMGMTITEPLDLGVPIKSLDSISVDWNIRNPGEVVGWQVFFSPTGFTGDFQGGDSPKAGFGMNFVKINGQVILLDISGAENINDLISLWLMSRNTRLGRSAGVEADDEGFYTSSLDLPWQEFLEKQEWLAGGPIPIIKRPPGSSRFQDQDPQERRELQRILRFNGLLSLATSNLVLHLEQLEHIPPLREVAQRISFSKGKPAPPGHGNRKSYDQKADAVRDATVSKWLESLTNGRYKYETLEFTAREADFYGSLNVDVVTDSASGTRVAFEDVGMGISQVLPILKVLAHSSSSRSSEANLILIEQPELHLHPDMQAKLAELFSDWLALSKNTLLIAETHSEAILLRIQKLVRDKVLPAEFVQILYVDQGGPGNKVSSFELNEENGFEANLPISFAGLRLLENL